MHRVEQLALLLAGMKVCATDDLMAVPMELWTVVGKASPSVVQTVGTTVAAMVAKMVLQ